MTITLVNPEIPQNTGTIARLCAVTNTTLELVHPLGFKIDDKHLRRAGLDYWKSVDVHELKSIKEFKEKREQNIINKKGEDSCVHFSYSNSSCNNWIIPE